MDQVERYRSYIQQLLSDRASRSMKSILTSSLNVDA